jgi:hypothetical protein
MFPPFYNNFKKTLLSSYSPLTHASIGSKKSSHKREDHFNEEVKQKNISQCMVRNKIISATGAERKIFPISY